MIIISKKNIIINIIALILIIFFSFHIFPKFGTYNKLDYKQIKVNVINTHLPYINLNFSSLLQKEELLLREKDKFLLEYINFLKKNPNFIVDAPCPSELLTNDLRNIQIYNDESNDGISNFEKFNVSFRFYNFTISDEKLDLNRCFNYIFIEAINRYYLIYREQKTKLLENELRFIQNLEKNNETQKKDFFKDQVKYFPNNLENDISTIAKFLTSNNEFRFKIEYYISLLDEIKNGDDFFIDPNLSYVAPELRKDKNLYKTIIFIICLMILVSINIGYRKLNRKQVSKFINKFVNTI
jgi:hypothetical protein